MKRIIIIVLLIIVGAVLFAKGRQKSPKEPRVANSQVQLAQEPKILYYTCGMHPSVRVSPQEHEKGSDTCPICHMFLVPVYEKGETIIDRENVVTIDLAQADLAGIETYGLKILPLFKSIETVGIVAYDPVLRTAQEEYLQALKTYKKISESNFQDAKERAKDILEASRIKLEVLGLNKALIKDLEKKGIADKSLILPDEEMWVYAHLYEHELSWPKIGDKVEMISESDPAVLIKGKVKSIEPIVQEQTRTLRLKILADNKRNILKPNMYVDVYLKMELGEALALPKDAVLDTGKRKVIYVDLGKGDFQLREVSLGPLAQGFIEDRRLDFYPLIEGAKAGELVVSKGNFLIDSQSQLGAAAAAYGGALDREETTIAPEARKHQH